jgi:hypothetical protein
MLNPSRVCCCGSPSCGAQYGQIRPYSQTSGFTYEVTDFQSDYGPPSLLVNWRYSELEIVETSTGVPRESGYWEAGCCAIEYPYDYQGTVITCYSQDPVFHGQYESDQMALHLIAHYQKMQCPEPIEQVFKSFFVLWTCTRGSDGNDYCGGAACNPLCPFGQFQELPESMMPTIWTGAELAQVFTDDTTVDPMTIGKGKLVATRSTGFFGFNTAIQSNNGQMLQATYNHRADFSQDGNACEGASVPIETPCSVVCACVSSLYIRTRMRQTIYRITYDCDLNQVPYASAIDQDVYLFYTGPLDGLLYDATAPNIPSRTFTLQEARIQYFGLSTFSFGSKYICDIPHPYFPISVCNTQDVGPMTSETIEEPDIECPYHCGTISYLDPVTGVGSLYNIINAAGAKQYGFPQTITVLRTST